MRRTWTMITGLAAGLTLTAGALVAAPAAQAAAPAAPTPLAALSGSDDYSTTRPVNVSWQNDPADNATAVTIAISPAAPPGTTGTCTTALDDTATTCGYSGLAVGTPYTFTVTVTNATGPTSGATAPFTPFTVPDRPTIVAFTNGVGQVWVDWNAPNNGGSAITGYTVTTNPSGLTCSPGTATECIITGMTDGTPYSVTVTATNLVGNSLASAPVTVAPNTNRGLPAAPTAVSAVGAGTAAVEVSFTPSTPITGFPPAAPFFTAICSRAGGASPVSVSGSASPITVTGLTNDQTYSCTVTATNANGNSAPSSASNLVVPRNVVPPGAPTALAAAGGAQQASLSWTAPAAGAPLVEYQVRYTTAATVSSPISTGSTARTFTVPGLPPGQYTFEVRAVNAGGAGAWSSPSGVVTVTAGTLNAPTAVTATPGVGQVSLAWTAPTGGTLSPTSYRVRYSSNNGSSWTTLDPTGSTSTTATVENLTNGTSYVFAVQSINGDVTSGWSTNSTAVSPGTPGKPTALAGKAGNAQVELTWTAPATATGVPTPTGYQVQYQVKGTTTWLPSTPLAATASPRIVTGLTNGTAYTFRVRAVNGPNVSGDWSDVSAEVTPVSPVVATIVIEGSRGTGNEANRIYVDGVTTGLVGQKVTPYFRFPGQSGFTAGTGTRTVDADGFFTWTRKTGKRIVVQFRFGDLRSNNAIIEPR